MRAAGQPYLVARPEVRPATGIQPEAIRVAAGNVQFGFNLLSKLVKEKPDGNILISPISLGDCLALALNGAKGPTATEMGHVMGIGGMTLGSANNGFAGLNESLTHADPSTEIDIANALWARQGVPLSRTYQDRCRRYLKA